MFTERFVIQPASDTKEVPSLRYPLNPLDSSWYVASLAQRSSCYSRESPQSATTANHEPTTGTTLWLSSQILTLYLTDLYGHRGKKRNKKLRAVELGSGIGLTALVLASLGIDVVATDLPVVIKEVLRNNIDTNLESVEALLGRTDVKVLDWTADPSTWRWDAAAWVSPNTSGGAGFLRRSEAHIEPPFDLLITSDTIYEQTLIPSLLRTLYQLSILSKRTLPHWSPHSKKSLYPLIFLSLERRDVDVVDDTLQQAQDMGFACEMIRTRKISKLMKKAGVFCTAEQHQGDQGDEEDYDEPQEHNKYPIGYSNNYE
ncbi:hypothetical protein EV426DRAFT_536887 [Tirmania nivea]|nr:hypothetical protein EV426DRAFT_536887 [Tirmania nivea]